MALLVNDGENGNIFKAIFNHKYFENTITIVIILTGILVGLQTSKEVVSSMGHILIFLDNIVIGIFVIEIIVGMLSESPRYWRYFYNGWHIFDFLIVAVCLLPLFMPDSNTQFFAVFRLARILRLAKIFERIKSLKILLTSLIKSLPSMSYVIILLSLLFYIYGIIATDLFGKYDSEQYGSIWSSMKVLLIVAFEGISGTLSDGVFQQKVGSHYPEWLLIVFFTSFLLIAAVIFLNLFIGIITSDMQTTKEEENRGKSAVVHSNHTVILGWSSSVYKIIAELIEANDSKERSYIVILANMDKAEMEHLIRVNIGDSKTTKIKCRSGRATVLDDLELTNYRYSKSIIILQDENEDNPDVVSLKAIIGLLNSDSEQKLNVVVELTDEVIIKKLRSITNDVIIFEKNIFVSKLIAQSVLQPYLSNIHSEVTGFAGCEFYLADEKVSSALVGLKYKDILFRFRTSSPIGFVINDKVVLNPNPEVVLGSNDKLIVLAEDDSTIKLDGRGKYVENWHRKEILKGTNCVENILILGSNSKLSLILSEIDSYLCSSINIKIVSQYGFENIGIEDYNYLNLELLEGDIDDKDLLIGLTNGIDSVLLLSYYDYNLDIQNSDAISLISLMHLREISKLEDRNYNIIAELIDDKNRRIINNPNVSDFIIGSQITSSILAQLSEEPKLYDIFNTLFSAEGGEIYLRNAENYLDFGVEIEYSDIVGRCLLNNETSIGYINFYNGKPKININPSKDKVTNFDRGDKLIVISENF